MRVAIVGAGAIGVTAAFDLASQGVDVTVYERGDVASGSSGRAAGVCYDAFADRVDAAIGGRALERFRELSGDGAFVFTDCPYVWLARDGDEQRARAIREQVPRMQSHGRDVTRVDPETLAERYPAISVDDVAVAAIARDAGYTDPESYTRLLAQHADAAGATVREHTAATLGSGPVVETADGSESFDAVLVAAGAHTKRVLSRAGISVPLKPYRVQALTTAPTDIDVPMLFDATGGYYLRPHGNGLFVGDGTEPIERDPTDWKRDADEWFVDAVDGYLETATGRTLAPERSWAGLCTATPDGNPLLGELTPRLFVAAGWQGHGFMRAPALGEIIAAQILGVTEQMPSVTDRTFDSEGVPAFDPTRFDGDEEFEIVEGMDVETKL